MLRRSVRTLGIEEFYTEFMRGVEDVLASHERPLILQVVPDIASELDAYRRWRDGGRVDGVILVDLLVDDDPRLALVRELGLHSVLLTPEPAASGHAAVVADERSPMLNVVGYLAGLGHRRIARVSGPTSFAHTVKRSEAFDAACRAVGLDGIVVEGDYTEEGGRRATAALINQLPAPTAMVFDNDVMAVAALASLRSLGIGVPDDVSLFAWDDSVACRVATPAVSALNRDVRGLGEQVAEALLASMETGVPVVMSAADPRLVERDSTASPRG
ncbi:LacI family DNA-binding transcriptional regulator [Tessaracoccus oleiagri]|uniref:LacI family DNA-binding transcriptional regulator n=1 Tax=Tessaracoccus oleiagri TaxID=686624 RepID=UPI00248140FC|nr:substrate-binding domain-containing protein [Tessaracoccus oleiagri]